MKVLLLLLGVVLPGAVLAVESIVLGRGGLSFEQVRETSDRLSIAADSLWIWQAERGENIAPRVLERGGRIFAIAEKADAQGVAFPALLQTPSIARMVDGDAGTAFDQGNHGITDDTTDVIEIHVNTSDQGLDSF